MWSSFESRVNRVVLTADIPLAKVSPSSAPSRAATFSDTTSEFKLERRLYSAVCWAPSAQPW